MSTSKAVPDLSPVIWQCLCCILCTLSAIGPIKAHASSDLSWRGADVELLAGSVREGLPGSINLDRAGVGLIAIDTGDKTLNGDLILTLSVQAATELQAVEVIWRDEDTGRYRFIRLPSIAPGVYRQSIAGVEGWPARSPKLVFKLIGAPEAQIRIERITLEVSSWLMQLRFLALTWLWPQDWGHGSINRVDDYTEAGARLPLVPTLASIVFFSILTVLLLRARGWLSGSTCLRIVSFCAVFAWVVSDLAWIRTLGVRAIATVNRFSGLDPEQALRASVDGPLVALAEEFRSNFDSGSHRVFVASAHDYNGMRLAYYLYPANVYWQRSGPELPDPYYLREGDLIAVVEPSKLEYTIHGSQLSGPGYPPIRVKPLQRGALGSLYMVQR